MEADRIDYRAGFEIHRSAEIMSDAEMEDALVKFPAAFMAMVNERVDILTRALLTTMPPPAAVEFTYEPGGDFRVRAIGTEDFYNLIRKPLDAPFIYTNWAP